MTWRRMPRDMVSEHPSGRERTSPARQPMPRWATRLVFLLTVLAWAVTLWVVANTRGAFQAFLTVFVLPIEEGLQFSRAVGGGKWVLAGVLGVHFITAVVYLLAWHRRDSGELRDGIDGHSWF